MRGVIGNERWRQREGYEACRRAALITAAWLIGWTVVLLLPAL